MAFEADVRNWACREGEDRGEIFCIATTYHSTSPHRLIGGRAILAAPIVFLPLGFERRADVDIPEWALAWAGVLAFLVLFGIAIASWQRRIPFLWVVVPLAVLGAAYSYYVYTAVVFINYAACIVPWAVDGERRRTARYTAMLVGVLFAIGLRMPDPDLRNWYWLVVPVFCITCAAFFLLGRAHGAASSTGLRRWPSASASRATCTTCWATRSR